MDLHVRNYILYKIRTLDERKKELNKLLEARERMRNEVIDSSPSAMDGQPRGKGGTSDPTLSKVLKLEQIDKRIGVIDNELKAIKRAEEKIFVVGGNLGLRIYNETIKHESNLEYKSMELGMGRATLWRYRSKLMEIFAKELGEYINLDELED